MNKFSSIFSQILSLFSRVEFERAVRETKAEHGAKGFTCWGQFVGMLFCQLGQVHSLSQCKMKVAAQASDYNNL
jgi:hypothetical protein